MLKTFERNVGNRGSKSNMSVCNDNCSIFVKEQRVDGKRVNQYRSNNGLQLRYTLKSFERNSVIKVLPNLLFNRNYTTTSLLKTTEFKLNP